MEFFEHDIYAFFLIFARISAVIMVAPVLGDKAVYRQAKLGLAALLTLGLFPLVKPAIPNIDLTLITAVVAMAQEIATGLIIGFFLQFLFAAVLMAGQFIGVDMGLAMATLLDPNSQTQISVIAQLMNLLALIAFILLDAHHFILQALSFSFKAIPVAGLHLTFEAMHILIKNAGLIFLIAIKIAAPAFVALFMTSITMGIAARAVPQMNIFFVAHPLRIGVGLASLITIMPLFFYVFSKLLLQFETELDMLIRAM